MRKDGEIFAAGAGSRANRLGRRELALRLGLAELGQSVYSRLALAGTDHGAVALVCSVGRVQRLANWAPCAAEAIENQVVLDRKLQTRAGELSLDG